MQWIEISNAFKNIQSLTTDFWTFVGAIDPAVSISVTLPGLGVAAPSLITLDVTFLTVLQRTSHILIRAIMAVGVPITPPNVRNALSIVTCEHVGITILVG